MSAAVATDAGQAPPADRELRLMGTRVRILVGPPAREGVDAPEAAADRVEAFLRDYEARLSRFREDSELSLLNADPREQVPASDLLRSAVRATVEAAEISCGLVDPTLLDDLRSAGYAERWTGEERIGLADALAGERPAPAPASASPQQRWREIEVDDEAGVIRRPPGLLIDNGGSGKGHAADLASGFLDGYEHWAVDCGGDIRIGGETAVEREVEILDAFTGEPGESIAVRRGAVATSGLRSRIWRSPDGTPAHHLLDPSTGRPAFTGLVSVTALAPSALEAETLAKAALLSGPVGARRILARHGGITVDENGNPERIGRLEARPVVKLKLPGGTPR
ncbi:MAG: FAD:protein FMN transferase [Solirubrobacterales bacterium]